MLPEGVQRQMAIQDLLALYELKSGPRPQEKGDSDAAAAAEGVSLCSETPMPCQGCVGSILDTPVGSMLPCEGEEEIGWEGGREKGERYGKVDKRDGEMRGREGKVGESEGLVGEIEGEEGGRGNIIEQRESNMEGKSHAVDEEWTFSAMGRLDAAEKELFALMEQAASKGPTQREAVRPPSRSLENQATISSHADPPRVESRSRGAAQSQAYDGSLASLLSDQASKMALLR